MHTIFLTSKCTRISVRNSLHRCKWRFEGDAHHRAVGFTSISSRPTTELLPTLQNSWKITYSEPFYRQTPNPPMMLGGNQSIGCVISMWEGLTFMSFMMIWKSPPKALHSFSIPASILPPRKHTRSGDTYPPYESLPRNPLSISNGWGTRLFIKAIVWKGKRG